MAKSRLKIWLISESVLWKTQTYIVEYVENFLNHQNGKISIEWRFIPWTNIWQELINAFKFGTPPDIFEFGSTWNATLVELGFLHPLDDFPCRKDILNKSLEEACIVKNRRFAIPWFVDLSIFTARLDILKKLNLEKESLNKEDLLKACEEIGNDKENNILPLGITFLPEPSLLHNLVPFFWGNGWNFPDFNKKPFKFFTDEKSIKTFDFLAKLWNVSRMPKTIAFTSYHVIQEEFFRNGSFAFFISHWSPDFINSINKKFPDYNTIYDFKIINYPSSFQWVGGSFLAISDFTREKDACYDFLSHFLSDIFLKNKILNEGRLSPYEKTYEGIDNKLFSLTKELIRKSKTYPINSLWFSLEKFAYEGLSEILWYLTDFDSFNGNAMKIAEKWDNNMNELFEIKWGII